jgi:methylmalonyl-CoA/ethylmalonyl-CoA epimerase
MHVDHVGVATNDAAGLANQLGELLGAPIVHEETFDGLDVVFLDPGGSELEFIEPVSGSGPVARFLDREGPGLHHIAFEVEDVGAALEAATAMGLDRIDDAPRPGARGHQVAFLDPRTCGGILVEFVEH